MRDDISDLGPPAPAIPWKRERAGIYRSGVYVVRRYKARGHAPQWWAYWGKQALGFGSLSSTAKMACQHHAAKQKPMLDKHRRRLLGLLGSRP